MKSSKRVLVHPLNDLTERECAELIKKHLPKVLPAGWRIETEGIDGHRYIKEVFGQPTASLITSFERHIGKTWLHISIAKPEGVLIRWEEIVEVKEIWMGQEAEAYQIIPRRSKHVNIHPNCFHLYSCLEGPQLPDMTWGGDSI